MEQTQAQRLAAAVLSVSILHSGCPVPAAWGHISLQQQSSPGPAANDAAFFTPLVSGALDVHRAVLIVL